MKQVTMYETIDGELHKTLSDAKKHAEANYANALSKLAAKLAVIDKHIATGDFIDANLKMFITLQTLKQDIELFTEEED